LHELVSLASADSAALNSLTRGSRPQPFSSDREHGHQRYTFGVDLERGESATWQLVYDVPLVRGEYRLQLLPQPLARPATLDLEITGENGGRLDRGDVGLRPEDGRFVLEGPWETTQEVAAQPHRRHGWEAFRHAIADFWTEPVGD
jgi:hypothetical protein